MSALKSVLAIGLILACGIGALAQGGDEKLPARSVPVGLEPYADVTLVLQNGRRVIGLLGTAQFDVHASDGQKSEGNCNSLEVQSFNRGFVLAHTGFNMFLALQEAGFTDLAGPVGMPGDKGRRFVQFGRSALLAAWTPKQIGQLLDLRQSLHSLPTPVKADLAAFLTKLREYRSHYARLKAAKPDLLEDLFEREDDAYYWYHAYVESNSGKSPGSARGIVKADAKGGQLQRAFRDARQGAA
jgi:hypothetical protein